MADEVAPTLQFRRNGVDNAFQTAHQHITKIDSNLDTCKDTIIETAAAFQALPGMKEQAIELKDAMVKLVKVQQMMAAYGASLDAVKGQYQPSLDKTDFSALLDEELDERASTINVTRDERMKELVEALGEEMEEQVDDDDEVIIAGAGQPNNTKCPITQKHIDDIEQPVVDEKGYIYDKQAIYNYISAKGGRAQCPQAGASHILTIASLKPATRILNRRRQQQRWGTAGTQATAGAGEPILEL